MVSLWNQMVDAAGGPVDLARLAGVFVAGVFVGAAIVWERRRA